MSRRKRIFRQGRLVVRRWRHTLRHNHSAITAIGRVLDIFSFLASIGCVALFLAYLGYDRDPDEIKYMMRWFRTIQGIYVAKVLFNLLFDYRHILRNTRIIKWVVDIGLLTTLLPAIYPHPDNPWIQWLADVLYSRKFLVGILLAYAVTDICHAVIQAMGKRTNPSLILSASFLVFIFIGSFLLMMPRCTLHPIGYVDSLFVATSAVCITGLTTIDVASTFTPLGLLVLGLLIQIGGLGVMTFTSFFALFFSGNTSVYNQLMIKDMVYSRNINSLLPTLLYILGFSITVEAVGAAGVWLSIHGSVGLTLDEEIVFSIFHSLSAFCNAGFSNMPGGLSNARLMNSDQSVYIVISLIVIAGSIGFPILVNFRDIAINTMRRIWSKFNRKPARVRNVHICNLNTKVALYTTTAVFIISVILFWLLERHNTLDGMSAWVQWVQAVFNSTTPRSSGFTSVNPAMFLDVTLVVVMFQMWIGGAAQSTAGGVKVNTLAAILLNLKTIVLGRTRVTAFHRQIATASIKRANAVVTISVMSLFMIVVAMLVLEPDLPARAVIFECVSGLFTVGSSLGITGELHTGSKILLCMAMFLGRVGIISLLVGITGDRRDRPVGYPEENLIIN
ncbi:TrkH family potassium uptake protein [uncultured Muribaculum sp.]|uniref:TrkH family potassium uptake protein n=1 Tax=uncultured Muribaculum sp. TaxID=1918613 RepID=UPI0025D49D74|nr:potassium transporter TrkG [uncultured Muribaculum sp.]